MNTQHSQRGAVFIYILMAVALFAALSYAVSRGNRGGVSNLTNEQAKLAAQEIIDYGNTVANAVQKLRLRGCSDTEISFENNLVGGYTNPNSPPDKSCHVYDINGANLNFSNGPQEIILNPGPLYHQGKYAFIASTEWQGVGTTCASSDCMDVLMIFSVLTPQACTQINNLLGFSKTPEDSFFGGSQFDGVYGVSYTLADELEGSGAEGKTAACFHRTGDDVRIYAQVLIAR